MNHLYIVRGLPGSGKSTFARKICGAVVEADQFFERNGRYEFNPSLLKEAHEWCYNSVAMLLAEGDVAVANTFTQIWEMQRYLDLPNPKTVITVEGDHGSIHNVPDEAIMKMANRWQMY